MDMEAILKAVWESGAIWKLGVAIAPLVWAGVMRAEWAKEAMNRTILDCVEAATVAVYHRIVRHRKAERTENGEKVKITDAEASQFRAAARDIAIGLAKKNGIDLTGESREKFINAMIEKTILGMKAGK